ncbi:MAG: hypothetical protein P4M11_08825 [Candidatus Pacebacteria bacterium]|nr:hypothetical protein [Candidatus Paceibacterota bacterium]
MSFLCKDDALSDDDEDVDKLYREDILNSSRLIGQVFTNFKSLAKSQCGKLRAIPLEGSKTLGDYLNGSSLGWSQEVQLTNRVSPFCLKADRKPRSSVGSLT